MLGHALQTATFSMGADEVATGARQYLSLLDGDTYPQMAAHVRWHAEGPRDDAFTFGLDLILDGLECAQGLNPR